MSSEERSAKGDATSGRAPEVEAYLTGITDVQRLTDCEQLMAQMEAITGQEAMMWGKSIVGFGRYTYRYQSGREGKSFVLGLSARKNALTLYLDDVLQEEAELVKALGAVTCGKGCLYIKRLEDVDGDALEALLRAAVRRRATP